MKSFCDTVEWIVRIGLAISFCAFIVAIVAQVASRNTGWFAIPASGEISNFFFVWSVFLGSSLAVRRNSHYIIDILMIANPVLDRAVAVAAGLATGGFIAFVMVCLGLEFALFSADRTFQYADVSVFWRNVALPVSGALSLVFLAERALAPFGAETRKDEPDGR